MLKDTAKKIDYYWLFFILTIVICFGYFVTNSSMSIEDDLREGTISLTNVIADGRLGQLLQYVIGYEYIPGFYEILGIIIYATAATLFADCFMTYINGFTRRQATIFACLFISFPFAAFYLIFLNQIFVNTTAIFLAALSTKLMCEFMYEKKSVKSILLCFICLLLSVSMYYAGIIYFLVAITFIIYKNDTKNRIGLPISVLLSSGTVAFYILILKIFKAKFNVVNDYFIPAIKYNLSSVKTCIKSLIVGVKEISSNSSVLLNYDFATHLIIASIIIFLLINIYISISKKDMFKFFLGLLIIILCSLILVITADGNLLNKEFNSYGILVAITFVLLYEILKNVRILKYLLVMFIALIILNNAKEINTIFYTEHQKFEHDLAIAQNVTHDLMNNNMIDKPVILVGVLKEKEFKNSYNIQAPEINISMFTYLYRDESFEDELSIQSGLDFINMLGNSIETYDNALENKEEIRNTVISMPFYPNPGYIRDMGKYVIVKIGPSAADKEKK